MGQAWDFASILANREALVVGAIGTVRLFAICLVAGLGFGLVVGLGRGQATSGVVNITTKEGVDWRKYSKFLDPQMKHIGHEKVQKIPKTLDIEPYQDEKDFHLLKRMKLHAR